MRRWHSARAGSMSLAVTAASGVVKRATSHSFGHGVAAHPSGASDDIRTVPEPLGRDGAGTTMICTHVPNESGLGVHSPPDG